MGLGNRLIHWGHFMFRWRSYTPLLLIPFLILEGDVFDFSGGWAWLEILYRVLAVAVLLAGEGIRLWTVGTVPSGTSGRNTKTQQASQLNSTGIYSIVRNPLYVGNYLIFMGITLLLQSWQTLIIFTVVFAMAYICIIVAEEDFLLGSFGDDFKAYQERVPSFLPSPSLWIPSDLSWSWRRGLKREHDTFFSIVLYLVLIEFLRSSAGLGEAAFPMEWLWILIGMALFTLVVKLISKYTPLLDGMPAKKKREGAAAAEDGGDN